MASTFKRRDVILGLIGAFIAWAWATHWFPSLRLVPYAFLTGIAAGIVLIFYILYHGTQRDHHAVTEPRPPSTALSFTSDQAWTPEIQAFYQRQVYNKKPIEGIAQPLSDSVDLVLSLALRDLVGSWYGKISNGSSFVNEIDRTIRFALAVVIERISSVDLPYFFATQTLPIINDYIDRFVEAEEAVHGKELAKKNITDTEELDVAIAARFNNGRLHPAASLAASRSVGPQQQHLRKLTEKLLAVVLPENMKGSSVVTALVREIVAGAVFLPLMQLLTDPDFINQQIEAYGHAVLQERKTVKKLRAALDEHASPRSKGLKSTNFPYVSPNDDERTFERFIRATRQLQPLLNATTVRNEVLSRLEQERINPNPNEVYSRRLEIGKRLLDQRIEQLSARRGVNGLVSRAKHTSGTLWTSADQQRMTLKDVLYDASGLAFFMEFMDRSGLMTCVQFWVLADGLRTPSEKSSDDHIEAPRSSWTDAERQQIANIQERYIWRPELKIPARDQKAIATFLAAGKYADLGMYGAARRGIMVAQARIFREMEVERFPAFTRSELYNRWTSPTRDARNSTSSSNVDPGETPRPTRPAALAAQTRSRTGGPVPGVLKSPDLRRAIASSSELAANFKKSAPLTEQPRRSLDDSSARRPLFDDEFDTDPLAASIGSLDSETESLNADHVDHDPAVDAVQAALDNIVDEDADNGGLFGTPTRSTVRSSDARRPPPTAPQSIPWPDDHEASPNHEKPSLASLGLLGTPSKRTVFNSDDLFGDSEKLWEDEVTDASADERATDEDDIKEAAPGDLGLAEVIQHLSLEIDKLEAQQSIVNSLLSKAELTNDAAELRILRKSQASLTREIRRKELQRQQYIVQENDNTLYGKASVAIKSIMLGTEPDGHEFALYVIEVSRPGGGGEGADRIPAASWAITRRYSEFHSLHKRLRRRFPFVRDIEFPRRQMVLTLQKEFIKKRRAVLERYLRELLKSPAICRSLELRAFLSEQAIPRPSLDAQGGAAGGAGQIDRRDFVTRIYNSVTDGMEEFLGNIPVLDQLSVAGQNLISAATTASSASGSPTTASAATFGGVAANGSANDTLGATTASSYVSPAIANDPATAAEARRELSALENNAEELSPGSASFSSDTRAGAAATAAATSSTPNAPKPQPPIPFITPLATTFLTLFRLRSSSSSSSSSISTSTPPSSTTTTTPTTNPPTSTNPSTLPPSSTTTTNTSGTPSTTSYLRGRAVVIVLHALLGGTVERRVRDAFASMTTPTALAGYLDALTDLLWPPVSAPSPSSNTDSKPSTNATTPRPPTTLLTQPRPFRTPAQRSHSRAEATLVLRALFAERVGGVVGRSTAGEAGARVGRMVGNERVVRSLGWEVLDGLVDGVILR